MIPIITVEGPTASGKTEVAVRLAEKLKTEIISADSRQIYKYFDIGTAKPSADILARAKHHLLSIIDPWERYNAGLFCQQASSIIDNLFRTGRIPIICGGTGLYVKALLEGLFPAALTDKGIREELLDELRAKGLDHLYRELKAVDPLFARKISCNDRQRIVRALEVYRGTGITITEHWQKQMPVSNYLPFRILLWEDRKILYRRINERVERMVKAGLIEEIESLLMRGYTWEAPAFNSVGYKEFRPYLEGTGTLQVSIALAQQHTRNYAKRQFTWYRKYNFNLTQPYSSIIIDNVAEIIKTYFADHRIEG